MVKAKNGKTVIGSYKTIREAAEAMVAANAAVNVTSAMVNIKNAIRGSEPRATENTRSTAYGYSWTQTVTKKAVTSKKETSKKAPAAKATKKTVKTSKKSR